MIQCHQRNKLGSKLRKSRRKGEKKRGLQQRKGLSCVLMKGKLRESLVWEEEPEAGQNEEMHTAWSIEDQIPAASSNLTTAQGLRRTPRCNRKI